MVNILLKKSALEEKHEQNEGVKAPDEEEEKSVNKEEYKSEHKKEKEKDHEKDEGVTLK